MGHCAPGGDIYVVKCSKKSIKLMAVKYNNSRIVPAPFVSIAKEIQTTDDGTKIGTAYAITLKGTLSAEKGSPTSSGTFWTGSDYPPDEVFSPDDRLGSLLRKQEALAVLFADEGRVLEIETPSEAYSRRCNPRVKRIEFPEGGQGSVSWFDKMPYTVVLEADAIFINPTGYGYSGTPNPSGYEDWGDPSGYKVQKASCEYNIEISDEKTQTYRLTKSVSATGKRFYSTDSGVLQKQAWEHARDYVLNKIGLGLNTDQMVATGVMNNNNLSAYNHLRTVHVGELAGTYQVTETWLCYNPGPSGVPAVDDRTFTVRGQDGRTTVSVEGSIQGLEVRDPSTFLVTSSKYTNANNKWTNYVFPNLASDAASVAGITLYPLAISTSLGVNQVAGIINYHWEFDDRADPVISGAISETFTINSHHQTDIFASIPVLGRTAGPVLQDIVTNSAKKRQLQIEAVMRPGTQSYTPVAPNTDAIVVTYIPGGTVFLDQDDESWSPQTGRYSRNVSWTWE